MKTKKRIIISVIAIVAIAIAVSISMVIAYMFKQSSDITNVFVPANVACKVNEVFENNTKTSVKVENTSNIDTYIRLRVVTHWEDSKGNIISRTSPEIKFGSDWLYNSSAWIYDDANQTFYHKAPVKAGEKTAELLNLSSAFEGIELNAVTEDINGVVFTYHPVMTFIAEAIQSKPNGNDGPVVEKWQVTLDSAGNIISVS